MDEPFDNNWGDEEDEEPNEEDRINLDRYFTVDQWELTSSRSRTTASEQCVVRFHDFENAQRPDRLLEMVIERLFERVLAGRLPPIRVGFQLQCPNFEKPFYIPMRPPQQNTARVIADALTQVCDQSGDGLDLFTGAAQTKVLCSFPPSNAGMGACAGDEQAQNNPAPCRSFVRVINPGDCYCLARAVIIGLLDRRCRQLGWSRQRFQQMCNLQPAHGPMAAALLHSSGCRMDQQMYGLRDVARVQQFLHRWLGAQQIRLVVFDQRAAYQIIWKGQHRAHFNLCLVFCADHYNYVAQPEQLMKARAYCVECESRVESRSHPDGCKAVCRLCLRFGFEQPCQRWVDGTARQECYACGFIFPNPECFAAHLRVVEPPPPGFELDCRRGRRPRLSMCQQRRFCRQCNAVVRARAGAHHRCTDAYRPYPQRRVWHQKQQQPQQMHDDDGNEVTEACIFCQGPHAPNLPCFVQPCAYECKRQLTSGNGAESPPPALSSMMSNDDDDEHEQQRHRSPSPPPLLAEVQQRERKPIRFLWWDVESSQEECDRPGQRKHIPILVCADVLCERCIDEGINLMTEPTRRAVDCVCGGLWAAGGRHRLRWAMPLPAVLANRTIDGRNPRRLHFHNFNDVNEPSPMCQFVDFLLHHGPPRVTTIALSHNGGKYDMHLLLEELQLRGVKPTRLLSSGLKFYVLELTGQNKRQLLSKDTLHFFGCALSALPRTFGLPASACTDKPYFPYGWIHRANLHTVLQGFPPIECYESDRMPSVQRAAFLRWYAEQQQMEPAYRFQLANELITYCANDVAVIRESVIRFRQLIGKISGGLEPFLVSSSIAGLALAIFRHRFLPANKLVHTPEGGLLRGRRASIASRRFFALLEQLHPGLHIRTAQWSIGEEQPDDSGLRIDGVIRRPPPLRPLALEFCGCYFHGCRECYPQGEQRLAGGQSAATLLEKTERRRMALERAGYEVIHVWECHFQQLLKGRPQLRTMHRELPVAEPLDLRKDAYFGGRVEPFRFNYRCKPDEEIVYIDIVSLYPWVMKYGSFPLGHPQVLTREQLMPKHGAELPWCRPEQQPYRGFVKCRVLPPRGRMPGNRPPLLPYRCADQRLAFPLCRCCAERRQQRQCRHGPAARSWIACYTHEELKKALALGYRVLDLFEVHDYAQWASNEQGNGLFSGYVNAFLKLKAESSGWPADCATPEQRLAFLREFAEKEGVELDPAEMDEPNAGMRYIAKIMLNSLYGKMGQRPEHTSIQYTTTARQFHQLLEDPTQEVLDFEHINERMDRVVVRKRAPFVQAPSTNSLAVACFVTSLARLRLYEYMEEAVLAGHRLLYCDTDSLLYVLRRGRGRPIVREGEWMGDMKRELPGRRLVEFIAAGPKNYGYVHVDRAVSPEEWREWLEAPGEPAADRMTAVLRIRGIQLTYTAQQLLNYTSMRRLVHDHFDVFGHRAAAAAGYPAEEEAAAPASPINIPTQQFVRTKRADVLTRRGHKCYMPVYSKGVVLAGGRARPFGWLPLDDDDDAAADRSSSSGEEEMEEQRGMGRRPPALAPTVLCGRRQRPAFSSEEEAEEEVIE